MPSIGHLNHQFSGGENVMSISPCLLLGSFRDPASGRMHWVQIHGYGIHGWRKNEACSGLASLIMEVQKPLQLRLQSKEVRKMV